MKETIKQLQEQLDSVRYSLKTRDGLQDQFEIEKQRLMTQIKQLEEQVQDLKAKNEDLENKLKEQKVCKVEDGEVMSDDNNQETFQQLKAQIEKLQTQVMMKDTQIKKLKEEQQEKSLDLNSTRSLPKDKTPSLLQPEEKMKIYTDSKHQRHFDISPDKLNEIRHAHVKVVDRIQENCDKKVKEMTEQYEYKIKELQRQIKEIQSQEDGTGLSQNRMAFDFKLNFNKQNSEAKKQRDEQQVEP